MTDLSKSPDASPSAGTLRKLHAARAHSAYERAVAACRHAGIAPEAAQTVPTSPMGRAANALRLSAQSLAALADTAPDPAADARCARNAAATAALAAQVATQIVAQAADFPDDRARTTAALRAALAASQAAARAAGGTAAGQDTALNAKADDTEERAVEAARTAGWT
ncbi:hypothetical protein [Streptomyces fuscichromogenes]|uniref:Uncharacterized protein n=1 Tax=Streptomyces fuscichromogenes TaxID=1324013 RepID=A0A917XBU8_9ACTN|nr:hypothetical protein [Streptomyces fuscichromogenes]GGN03575.1 hypothetical protein GCM10011578_026490 [Streptomyces fuscichromogenes]